jgi:hypothetical protein
MKKLNRYSFSDNGDAYVDNNGDYCWSDHVMELEDENKILQEENEKLKYEVEVLNQLIKS